jgi:YfiH family protein
VLVCTALEPFARHLFTTRELEFRPVALRPDYERVAQALSVRGDDVVRVRQVHGSTVFTVERGQAVLRPPDADAVISLDPARAASVRTADCVPILIADRRGRLVAAVHAGWRGTAAGVTQATLATIGTLGVQPSDLMAALGPAAGSCCYQVDDAVRRRFVEADPRAGRWFARDGERWRLDLAAANCAQLVAAGVSRAHVFLAGLCTIHDHTSWHSYRREGADAGRMVAAIRLQGPPVLAVRA